MFDTNFDETLSADEAGIGKIEVIQQDIGRVLLNLFNNAFYSVNEKKKQQDGTFEPVVSVSTERVGDKVEVRVKDNRVGIPQKAAGKIFQPFFTAFTGNIILNSAPSPSFVSNVNSPPCAFII